MQLINSDHQHTPTSNPAREQWEQTLALEQAQDEVILLREQISSLQQYLSEQLQQKQAVEQELYYANQELELMNAENQQLVEIKQLLLEEIKELARTLPADEEISRAALTKLLSKFCHEIFPSKELESVTSTLRAKEYATYSNPF